MEIDIEAEKLEIAKRYKSMLKYAYQDLNKEDIVLIRKAFDLAKEAHKKQRRKSGEPYIYHPIAVAEIVADEIGLGATSIAAALLHDVVEDTRYTLDDINGLFGAKITSIIDGLTKIAIINNQDISIQSENYRKLLLTLSDDFRVIIIKIADRLHNMRTLESMPKHKQLKIASETTYIYAPLAHRMGLYNIKTELEDLSLKYRDPEIYQHITDKLEEDKVERDQYIEDVSNTLTKRLEEEKLNFTIKGRPKSIYSIRKKMEIQGVTVDNIFDKFALRIIYKSDLKNEKFLAWKIYSIVTDEYKPNPSRLRDWISQKRSTGYESLHITVMGPGGKWVEVQIRSERMDEIAEKGIAAHYKYKEGFNVADSHIENWIIQVREFLDNQEFSSADEMVNNFQLNLYYKEVFIFTPKGELKVLPNGSTTLDFAYSVHTKVGDTCLGAKVNGKLVPLSHVLKSGDQVEIITSKNQKPKPNWLDFVKTSRAKSKIKSALNSEKKITADLGKEILLRKLRHLKIQYSEKELDNIQKYFKEKTSSDLFYNIGIGKIDSKMLKKYSESKNVFNNFINRIRNRNKDAKKEEFKEVKKEFDDIVFGDNEEKLEYQLAVCCNPIPGDKVFGFLSINKGITVHKDRCKNSINLRANYDYRILKAKWIDSKNHVFDVNIIIEGLDTIGMLNDISKVISSNLTINMKSFQMSSDAGLFEGKILLEVKNKNQLERLIQKLKKIEGINSINRLD